MDLDRWVDGCVVELFMGGYSKHLSGPHFVAPHIIIIIIICLSFQGSRRWRSGAAALCPSAGHAAAPEPLVSPRNSRERLRGLPLGGGRGRGDEAGGCVDIRGQRVVEGG